jgi:hypothetical protein
MRGYWSNTTVPALGLRGGKRVYNLQKPSTAENAESAEI